MAVASKVFAENGYRGGSLRDISRQLGVSPTSLIHHFGTKSGLLIAVLENADHAGSGWWEGRVSEAGVRVAMSEIVASNLSRPNLLRLYSVLSSEASAPDHPAHEWFVIRYRRIIEGLATAIRHDQSRGRISPSLDPVKAAQLLLAAWDGLQLQWLLDPNEDMVAQIQSMMAGLFGADPSSSHELQTESP